MCVFSVVNNQHFFSFICMKDLTARLEYPSSHVSISPNNFVLMEKASMQVTIIYQPLQEDALKSQGGTYTTSHLVVYSGDEVLRREYKRYFIIFVCLFVCCSSFSRNLTIVYHPPRRFQI